ncbi:uncharacterized protein PV09_00893 [Verruconis gallopava]|uniref:Uncharacterized protein n=1 Tax=Verruconis gallopava TaxID=253628 RepID=A0A0D2AR91_9PEZI|nr:uncharacterized protein PV09_00893 [Verruconis gallopava]KIW08995.1 hypothetical protein PV09_00893 [Verruconis gallopava]
MTKRIKLKVQRNRLPDVDVVWAVKDVEGRERCTVSKLIADVDQSIPLESGEWTLDQYVVELDGYECLHYQFVSDVLKDGDEVIIRPLTSPDIKARRLCGRTQITGEGFHILDGVPYGMQPNQRPPRPGILIPSRKRRRPELEEEDYDDSGPATIADIEDDDELLAHVNGGQDEDTVTAKIEAPGKSNRRIKKQKNVHFSFVKDIPDFQVEDDERDEDDSDFDPDTGSKSSDLSEDEQDEDNSDDVSGSESSSEASSTSEEDSSSSEESDLDSDSAASSPEVLSTKQANGIPSLNGTPNLRGISSAENSAPKIQFNGIPYSGSSRTRERNKRRRIYDKMQAHVRSIIGSKATKKECHEWLKNNPDQAMRIHLTVKENLGMVRKDSEEEGGRIVNSSGEESSHLIDQAKTNVDGSSDNQVVILDSNKAKAVERGNIYTTGKESANMTKRREDCHDNAISPGPVNGSNDAPLSNVEVSETVDKSPKHTPHASESSDMKRVRLDINGSRRAIFGALGQRTPKTQQDADRVRTRLAGLGKPKSATTMKAPAEEEVDPLSDAWRSKIRLLAVDCDNPEIKLSEPPYPFKQRWDPSQQRNNWWTNGGKQRKKKARNSYGQNWEEGEDEYEGEYWEAEDFSGLDYDETEAWEGEEADELAERRHDSTTLAKTQSLPIAADVVDDLPSLPADISSLPNLKEEDLKQGALIAFKQLECNQATNWAPLLSAHRTAEVVQEIQNGVVEVRLAIRDRTVKNIRYDQDGKRVYEKFEMDDGDDDAEDDGIRELNFTDMVDAKLLKSS